MERTGWHGKVFLSYRSADRAAVEEFAGRLRRDGIDAWYDQWKITPGDDIVARMDQGVDGCTAGLIFVSLAWFEGPWAQNEYTSLGAVQGMRMASGSSRCCWRTSEITFRHGLHRRRDPGGDQAPRRVLP